MARQLDGSNRGTILDNFCLVKFDILAQDGKDSAQFEQTLLVTDTGYEILTLRRENDGKPHFMTQ